MSTPKVYADFHNLDEANRLRLTCAGTAEDLRAQGIELREGLALTFYMDDADDLGQPDDLLVDGVVQYHAEDGTWVALVEWSKVRHASEERSSRNGAHSATTPGSVGFAPGAPDGD